jgi:glutathione peroxidase
MKIILLSLVVIAVASFGFYKSKFGSKSIYAIKNIDAKLSSIHQFKIKAIDGTTIDFAAFKGKKILVVNTASECGFTPQYEGLEKLYEANKNKLVVVGFPCNQFGKQEPGTEQTIEIFCKSRYGVTFPLAAKVDVKGDSIAPIYKWLCNKTENGVLDATIKWNFNKFMLDENGVLLAYFSSAVKPDSDEILNIIK